MKTIVLILTATALLVAIHPVLAATSDCSGADQSNETARPVLGPQHLYLSTSADTNAGVWQEANDIGGLQVLPCVIRGNTVWTADTQLGA